MIWMWIIIGICMAEPITGQIGRIGLCPWIPNMDDFDQSEFAGTWYVIVHNKNPLYGAEQKCSQWNYISNGTSLTALDYYSIIEISGARIDWEGKLTPIDGESSGKFEIRFPKPAIRKKAEFQILATDYYNYAIQWDCQNSGDIKLEYIWILSRTPTLERQYREIADYFIYKYNHLFGASLAEVDQMNCPKS